MNRLKHRFPIILPIASLVFFGIIAGFIFWLHTPNGRAWQLDRLAKKLPPSSLEAIRYRAMAQALREGKKYYTYSTNHAPPAISGH